MDSDFIDQCLALRELPMEEVMHKLSISEQDIDREANYEKLKEITEFRNPASHPGFFYYRDGLFTLLYVGVAEELDEIDPDDLENRLGVPAKRLRSRAGKRFMHYVYPEEGMAFSTDGREVRILEIFPATTLDSYLADIYKKPGKFRK